MPKERECEDCLGCMMDRRRRDRSKGGCDREKSLIRDTAPLVIHSCSIHKKNKSGRDGQGEMRRF